MLDLGHLVIGTGGTEARCYLFGVCGPLRNFSKVHRVEWGPLIECSNCSKKFRVSSGVEWGRVIGNYQGRANGVSQFNGDSDLLPTCACRLGAREWGEVQQRKNGAYQLFYLHLPGGWKRLNRYTLTTQQLRKCSSCHQHHQGWHGKLWSMWHSDTSWRSAKMLPLDPRSVTGRSKLPGSQGSFVMFQLGHEEWLQVYQAKME